MQAHVIIDHATSLFLCWRGAVGKRSLLRWNRRQNQQRLVFWPQDAEQTCATLKRGNIYEDAWFGWAFRRLSFAPSSFHPIAVHCEGHSGSFKCTGWPQTQLHSLLLGFPQKKKKISKDLSNAIVQFFFSSKLIEKKKMMMVWEANITPH